VKRSLTIVPFDDLPKGDLEHLIDDLRALNFEVGSHRPLPVPMEAYDARRAQYRANVLLARVASVAGDAALGVTGVDIYAGNLNFVFGLAQSPGRAALISLHRLRAGEAGRTRERAVKEVVHEYGHLLGLPHCPDPRCVMHFSNGLADTDRKRARFCGRCGEKLSERWRTHNQGPSTGE
jgi:archaemetzincin